MKLQVKELNISKLSEVNGEDGSIEVSSIEVADSYNFSCVFNRNIEAEETGSIEVKLYTAEGTEIEHHSLAFGYNDTQEASRDTIYFELLAPDNYGDDEIYVHAYIDDTNSIVFEANSSIQEATIKKIFFRAKPEITNVYWSFTENIEQGDQDDSRRTQEDEICRNEDAFLHIKGKGLKNQEILISILEDDTCSDDELFMNMRVTMESNITSISLKMSDIIAKYKLLHNTVGLMFESDELEIKARVKIGSTDEISETDLLHLKHEKDAKQPIKSTNTGLVITLQGNVDNTIVEPEEEESVEYTNFEIGLVAELKSNGTIRKGIPNNLCRGAVLTYPFNFYTLTLKDLVDCEILTADDARLLTIKPNNVDLYTDAEMTERFDKYRRVGTDNESIVERFADTTDSDIISTALVKKVLDHVKAKNLIPTTFNVCRDAWQTGTTRSDRAAAQPTYRYYMENGEGSECPPGGHFINYQVATYEIYFSNLARNRNNREVKVGSFSPNRAGMAIHQGTSYFATGCTTLYTDFNIKSSRDPIVYLLFKAGLKKANYDNINKKRLILVLIEERNAEMASNYKRRWYDFVLAPGEMIRGINMIDSASIVLGENIDLSLDLRKETVTNYIIPQEEKEHIRWKYKVGSSGERAIPNSNGLESCTLLIERSWAGQKLEIIAIVEGSSDPTRNNAKPDRKSKSVIIPSVSARPTR